jgi:hypothetical protein
VLNQVSVEDDINVYLARTPVETGRAPDLPFDFSDELQQSLRAQIGLAAHGSIEEIRLLGVADGFGNVDRGLLDLSDRCPQQFYRLDDMSRRIADV